MGRSGQGAATTHDANGNLHRAAGSSDGGQFAPKQNARPTMLAAAEVASRVTLWVQPQFWDGDYARDAGPAESVDVTDYVMGLTPAERARLVARGDGMWSEAAEALYDRAVADGRIGQFGPFGVHVDADELRAFEGEQRLTAWRGGQKVAASTTAARVEYDLVDTDGEEPVLRVTAWLNPSGAEVDLTDPRQLVGSLDTAFDARDADADWISGIAVAQAGAFQGLLANPLISGTLQDANLGGAARSLLERGTWHGVDSPTWSGLLSNGFYS